MKHVGVMILTACLWGGPGLAETVVAARTLRAQTIIAPEDITVTDAQSADALADPAQAIGLETRSAIYAGRPIRPEDLRAPAIIERNQIVPLSFRRNGLSIQTEGRALERAGVGDTIRVMNLTSKTTLNATIAADGSAVVLNQ
ncbi:MAG: flagellar basal body P-ring formation protein FlgA [Sphingomonadales bacterium]|nr:flagellar basal body P-ring formation protein FlgA [Sphingomonadales bacterium]